jgi:hypothetical protein
MAHTNILQDEILKPLKVEIADLVGAQVKVSMDETFAQHGTQWLNLKPIGAAFGVEATHSFPYTYSILARLYTINSNITGLDRNNSSIEALEKIKNGLLAGRHGDTNWVYLSIPTISYIPDLTEAEAAIKGMVVREMLIEIIHTECIS